MSKRKQLDVWTEGYLSYLVDVQRQARGTVRDVRSTLKRVSTQGRSIIETGDIREVSSPGSDLH